MKCMNFVNTEKSFGKPATKILMADGAEVEDLETLRDDDHLYFH